MSNQNDQPEPEPIEGELSSTGTDYSPTYGQGDDVVVRMNTSGQHLRGEVVAENSVTLTILYRSERDGVTTETEYQIPWTSIQWVTQLRSTYPTPEPSDG